MERCTELSTHKSTAEATIQEFRTRIKTLQLEAERKDAEAESLKDEIADARGKIACADLEMEKKDSSVARLRAGINSVLAQY